MTNLERMTALRRELDELEPLDESNARLLKNKIETVARRAFPEDGRHLVAVLNVDFSPPAFHLWPHMMEEDETDAETLKKWAKAVCDLEIALDTMIDDLTLDTPRAPVSKPARSTRPTTVTVYGDHNTVVASSSHVNIGAPAAFPADDLKRALADNAQALKYVAALEAETKKRKPSAGIVTIAIETLKAIPVAAPIVGRWLADPASQTWVHHVLVAAGILPAGS